MKALTIAGLALATVMAFSACNTVHGFGQDVRNLGTGIEHSSR
jgi:predicted small secreted protein